jgi:hypothetical protein
VTGRVVRAGLLYFALTFGAGFVLGPLRILFLVPRVGERTAELLELPVMIGITWLAARWVTGRLAVPPRTAPRLAVGAIAGALLLVAEFTLVLRLRGLTLEEYFATRDPVAGAAYYAAVLLHGGDAAAGPWRTGTRPGRHRSRAERRVPSGPSPQAGICVPRQQPAVASLLADRRHRTRPAATFRWSRSPSNLGDAARNER